MPEKHTGAFKYSGNIDFQTGKNGKTEIIEKPVAKIKTERIIDEETHKKRREGIITDLKCIRSERLHGLRIKLT